MPPPSFLLDYLARPPGVVLWLTAALALLAAALLWPRRRVQGATALFWLEIAVAFWACADAFGLAPFAGFNPVPTALAVAGLLLAAAIRGHRLFSLIPVARHELIERLADGVLVLDPGGTLIDLNPAAQRLLDLQPEVHVGRPLAPQLPFWKATRNLHVDETRSVVFDLGEAEIEARLAHLRSRRGEALGFLVVLRDVTLRRQAEAALQSYAAELETRNEELDAFAQTVAHDLKNPLNLVLNYADLLEADEANLPPDVRADALRTIVHMSRKMDEIIQALLLLAFVRREAVRPTLLDMDAIVREVLDRLHQTIEAAGATIRLPGSWPEAFGYAPWVEQVWENYLSNAVKYSSRPACIELGAERLPDDHVRFWVRDNGPGLTAEEQARLFTPFTRLGHAHEGGHGLGLSIVQKIVEKLGGTAGVESTPGLGSRFYFTLPNPRTGQAARPGARTPGVLQQVEDRG